MKRRVHYSRKSLKTMKYSFEALDKVPAREVLSIPSGPWVSPFTCGQCRWRAWQGKCTRHHRTPKVGVLGNIHKTYTPMVTIKEHPNPAQRSLYVQRRGGGCGPELVMFILLPTHTRRKLSLLDSSSMLASFLIQESLQTPIAQSQELSTSISQYWLPETELWAPQAAKYFHVPPSKDARRLSCSYFRLLASSNSLMCWLLTSLLNKKLTVERWENMPVKISVKIKWSMREEGLSRVSLGEKS